MAAPCLTKKSSIRDATMHGVLSAQHENGETGRGASLNAEARAHGAITAEPNFLMVDEHTVLIFFESNISIDWTSKSGSRESAQEHSEREQEEYGRNR